MSSKLGFIVCDLFNSLKRKIDEKNKIVSLQIKSSITKIARGLAN